MGGLGGDSIAGVRLRYHPRTNTPTLAPTRATSSTLHWGGKQGVSHLHKPPSCSGERARAASLALDGGFMQPIGNYLPDFGKRSRVDTLEQAVLDLAKQVRALEKEVYNLKYKGQCE